MRIAAHTVRPGDRIRGIGLVVEYSEPASDATTRLEGHLSVRTEGGFYEHPARVDLPNEHVVNVVRSDENFRADRIRWIDEAVGRLDAVDEQTHDQFLVDLTRVANAPRGRFVTVDQVREVIGDADVSLIDYDELLDALDAIESVEYNQFEGGTFLVIA